MSVTSVANFATAVDQTTKKGTVYAVTGYTPNFASGASSVTITKTGAAFLTVIFEGVSSQFEPVNDANLNGMSVRWVGADGVQHVSDAQAFVNWLAAN